MGVIEPAQEDKRRSRVVGDLFAEDGRERSLHANRLRTLRLVGRISTVCIDKLMINYPTALPPVPESMWSSRWASSASWQDRSSSGGSRHANSKLAGPADVLRFLNEHTADYTRCTGAAEQLYQLKAIY
jgi:hypothetical protein